MSTTTNNNDSGISNTCANCGKVGSDVTNTCNKCKSVMYCNAACKKKHRHKHKKDCERRVAVLHDEKLFKQPPPEEDCPICMIRIPSLMSGSTYKSCCGKVICNGCIYATNLVEKLDKGVNIGLCPFCRVPTPTTDKDVVNRTNKRMEVGDAEAIHNRGDHYANGRFGFPQDYNKALEFYHRAAELGHAESYYNIGNAYYFGRGVEVDEKKAQHYFELAAMRGDAMARHNLGYLEKQAGNMDRALKHYMIAVTNGWSKTLINIRLLFENGYATKDDYAKALESYQIYLSEIRSEQRDEAAAAYGEDFQYILALS